MTTVTNVVKVDGSKGVVGVACVELDWREFDAAKCCTSVVAVSRLAESLGLTVEELKGRIGLSAAAELSYTFATLIISAACNVVRTRPSLKTHG